MCGAPPRVEVVIRRVGKLHLAHEIGSKLDALIFSVAVKDSSFATRTVKGVWSALGVWSAFGVYMSTVSQLLLYLNPSVLELM